MTHQMMSIINEKASKNQKINAGVKCVSMTQSKSA